MQFGMLLKESVIDEWKEHYISYDALISTMTSSKRGVFGFDAQLQDELENNTICHKYCCNKKPRNVNDSQYIIDIYKKRSSSRNTPVNGGDKTLLLNQDAHIDNYENENINTKEITIQKWQSIINSEAIKVNEFYISIEKQLFREYTIICGRLNKLHKTYKKKYSCSLSNSNKIRKQKQNIFSTPNMTFTFISDTEEEQEDHLYANANDNEESKQYLEALNIPKSKQSKDVYLQAMKINIFVLYQRFIVLSNFSILNHIGFETVINKFNNELECNCNINISNDNFEFITSKKCNECMNGLIKIYSNIYEFGDVDKGKVRLLDSISWSNTKNIDLFLIGSKFGIMFGILCWAIFTLINNANNEQIPQNVIYLYRSCGVLLLLLWFWAIDVYIWSKKRINFVFIFELNPRTRLTHIQYFDTAITLTIIYLINVILFIETVLLSDININKYAFIWPVSLFIFFIIRLILPIFDNWSSRKIILNAVFQCIIAPFGVVGFRDFFCGDVLTSLSKVFVDMYMSGCIIILNEYSKGSTCSNSSITTIMKPLLICSPYWYRFMQCINRYYITGKRAPNGFNALKYGASLSVTLLGAFHASYTQADFDGDEDDQFDVGRGIWLTITLMSTFYLIFWDLKMDWNFFPWNKRIRNYPIGWYYFAIINDCILRFFWTFTLFPSVANPYFADSAWNILTLDSFLAFIEIAEIFRRCVWALFRVEKAHNLQKEEFRKYEYIPLFYENNTLIKYKQKKSKPATMFMEVIAMCILLCIITVIIVLTKE